MFIAGFGRSVCPPSGGPCPSVFASEQQKLPPLPRTYGPPTEGETSHHTCYKHDPPTEGSRNEMAKPRSSRWRAEKRPRATYLVITRVKHGILRLLPS